MTSSENGRPRTRLDRLEAARARGDQAGYVGSTTVQVGGKYTPAEAKA